MVHFYLTTDNPTLAEYITAKNAPAVRHKPYRAAVWKARLFMRRTLVQTDPIRETLSGRLSTDRSLVTCTAEGFTTARMPDTEVARYRRGYKSMARIIRETDFARITVTGKGQESEEFLLEHALHQLLAKYRHPYGFAATQEVLCQLAGYHGRPDSDSLS